LDVVGYKVVTEWYGSMFCSVDRLPWHHWPSSVRRRPTVQHVLRNRRTGCIAKCATNGRSAL